MTRMQLEGAGAEELEDLSARIEAELTRRALAERGGARWGRCQTRGGGRTSGIARLLPSIPSREGSVRQAELQMRQRGRGAARSLLVPVRAYERSPHQRLRREGATLASGLYLRTIALRGLQTLYTCRKAEEYGGYREPCLARQSNDEDCSQSLLGCFSGPPRAP